MDKEIENVRSKRHSPLNRNTWIHAAIDILADAGIAGLRIEALAKKLKVTKGSFYWHFQNRHALLLAVLEYWKAGRIGDIIKQTTAKEGEALKQLYHVIEIYSARRNSHGMKIELAVREWAYRDNKARAIVAEIDQIRLERSQNLFLACGFSQEEALSRSMLLYAYVFGVSLMIYDNAYSNITQLKQDIAHLITHPQ